MKEISNEESQLLIMLAEGNEYAFQLLFNKYKDHIYKVATLYVKSPIMAEEILQDVFMKVWLHRKSLSGIISFRSWLFVVSKHLIFNYNKRLAAEWDVRQRYTRGNKSAENNADYKIRAKQYQQLVDAAVMQLPPQQQAVYKMAREEQLSYQQIAGRLAVSTLTVKTHMSRALQAIRTYLHRRNNLLPVLLFLTSLIFFDGLVLLPFS